MIARCLEAYDRTLAGIRRMTAPFRGWTVARRDGFAAGQSEERRDLYLSLGATTVFQALSLLAVVVLWPGDDFPDAEGRVVRLVLSCDVGVSTGLWLCENLAKIGAFRIEFPPRAAASSSDVSARVLPRPTAPHPSGSFVVTRLATPDQAGPPPDDALGHEFEMPDLDDQITDAVVRETESLIRRELGMRFP